MTLSLSKAHIPQIAGRPGFWWRNLSGTDLLEDPGVDGRIILRSIFRKWDVGTWTGSIWLRIGTDGGHL